MRSFILLGLLLIAQSVRAETNVAIIIDDLGHNYKRGVAFIELPVPITFAVLPHTTHGTAIARAAHAADKEVIIHLPMANLANKPIGPGGLTASLPRVEFLTRLDAAIRDVPHAKGINNHTGSYLTQQSEQMSWLMTEMKQREFFFIDSRTTPKSVAREIADQYDVFASSRDIFLDNDRSEASIDKAFKKLIRRAEKEGTAIAIGHPYPETLEYLESALPKLAEAGVKVLPASSLIALQHLRQTSTAGVAAGVVAEVVAASD